MWKKTTKKNTNKKNKKQKNKKQKKKKKKQHLKSKHGKRRTRECLDHKTQPFLDTKRKRKQTSANQANVGKNTNIISLFPKRGNPNAQRTEQTLEQNNTRQN